MSGTGVQMLGFYLGLLGFAGAVAATLLPHWRRSAYVGANIITSTGYMKGLWMECVWHSTGIYQCEVYRSLLALPQDLQAARALMVLSCVTSVLAVKFSLLGMKCTRLVRGSFMKSPLVLSAGVCFLCAALLCLVTVCWTTNDVIRDFYEPYLPGGLRYELGASVYLGYGSACLSLSAGMLLCWAGCGERSERNEPRRNRGPASTRLNNTRPPAAPLYRPAPALKGNLAPSLSSVSSQGYRLNNYV